MTDDSLEQVQAEIDAFKREEAEYADPERLAIAREYFACTSEAIDESCGGEDLVCICDFKGPDEFGNDDQLEHRNCPIHGEVTD